MKIINFIEPSSRYPILTERVKKEIDYVVNYYQSRKILHSNNIRVPKFLFRSAWPNSQHMEEIVGYISFRTGLTIAKVDKAFHILMGRKSLETIHEYLKSIPKGKYLIYLKGIESEHEHFLLEDLMKDCNNLIIATGGNYFYKEGFKAIDINTLLEDKNEILSLITGEIKSTLPFNLDEEVLYMTVKELLDKGREKSAGQELNMSIVYDGINDIKKVMHELHSQKRN